MLQDRLLLVSDTAGWVIGQVARDLYASLPQDVRGAVVVDEWRTARNCVVHFIHRGWAWADGVLDVVHPSNQLIGLWWHGRLGCPDPEIQASLDRVRRLHARFTRMQATCTSGTQTLRELGVPEEKIIVLPEGVDLRRFRLPCDAAERWRARSWLGVPSEAIAIGCFQKDGKGWGEGLEPKRIKGPDVLADVLARLHRQYPVHAVIPGPARGYLTRRLAEAAVPFSSPGFVEGRQLPRCYHALDLYLSPSRDEGGPAGVLEAIASGVPVVSTRTGMPADMVQHGVNGFLVDSEDVEGLVACATELIEHPELRQRIAGEALRTIQAYDWAILGPRYAKELYRPVMEHR